MCRKGFSLIPFKCSNCGYRTPYDKKSSKWYPYLHHGTKYGTWFIAKCNECGKKSKFEGIIWLIIGGAIIGTALSFITSKSSSIEPLILSMPFLIIISIAFIIALAFFTTKWVPYDKENT